MEEAALRNPGYVMASCSGPTLAEPSRHTHQIHRLLGWVAGAFLQQANGHVPSMGCSRLGQVRTSTRRLCSCGSSGARRWRDCAGLQLRLLEVTGWEVVVQGRWPLSMLPSYLKHIAPPAFSSFIAFSLSLPLCLPPYSQTTCQGGYTLFCRTNKTLLWIVFFF